MLVLVRGDRGVRRRVGALVRDGREGRPCVGRRVRDLPRPRGDDDAAVGVLHSGEKGRADLRLLRGEAQFAGLLHVGDRHGHLLGQRRARAVAGSARRHDGRPVDVPVDIAALEGSGVLVVSAGRQLEEQVAGVRDAEEQAVVGRVCWRQPVTDGVLDVHVVRDHHPDSPRVLIDGERVRGRGEERVVVGDVVDGVVAQVRRGRPARVLHGVHLGREVAHDDRLAADHRGGEGERHGALTHNDAGHLSVHGLHGDGVRRCSRLRGLVEGLVVGQGQRVAVYHRRVIGRDKRGGHDLRRRVGARPAERAAFEVDQPLNVVVGNLRQARRHAAGEGVAS